MVDIFVWVMSISSTDIRTVTFGMVETRIEEYEDIKKARRLRGGRFKE